MIKDSNLTPPTPFCQKQRKRPITNINHYVVNAKADPRIVLIAIHPLYNVDSSWLGNSASSLVTPAVILLCINHSSKDPATEKFEIVPIRYFGVPGLGWACKIWLLCKIYTHMDLA